MYPLLMYLGTRHMVWRSAVPDRHESWRRMCRDKCIASGVQHYRGDFNATTVHMNYRLPAQARNTRWYKFYSNTLAVGTGIAASSPTPGKRFCYFDPGDVV